MRPSKLIVLVLCAIVAVHLYTSLGQLQLPADDEPEPSVHALSSRREALRAAARRALRPASTASAGASRGSRRAS